VNVSDVIYLAHPPGWKPGRRPCREARLRAMRRAAAAIPRAGELSEDELLRICSRTFRNPMPQKPMSLSEIVAKSHYRSRSRRTR
jgi:hypothetical protein